VEAGADSPVAEVAEVASAASVAAALVVEVLAEAGNHSTDSLPEIYFLHFSITWTISSGRLESKKSLFPVTG